jgi:hypothetical protein
VSAGQDNEDGAIKRLSQLLYSPVREAGVTCGTCTTPVYAGETRCHQCRDHRLAFPDGVADLVVPLTYASETETPQIRRWLRLYKDGYTEDDRAVARAPLTFLVAQFAYRHGGCLAKVAGGTDAYVTVPSGTPGGRGGSHPVGELAKYIRLPELHLDRTQAANPRYLSPGSLELRAGESVEGLGVVVVDDTWTSGASAQSAAIALKQAGARWVGTVTLGRWTNTEWTPTGNFYRARPRKTWDPFYCPVTGGTCP